MKAAVLLSLLLAGVVVSPAPSLQLTKNNPAGEKRTKQEAEALWERAIAAKGGRERLAEVQSMLISSRATKPLGRPGFEGLAKRYESLSVFPDRYWEWLDDRPSKFGLSLHVHNGKRGVTWTVYDFDRGNPKRREASSTERYGLESTQLIYLLETRWVKPEPQRAWTESLRGQSVYVVYATAGAYMLYYYLDQQTYLPLKVRIRGISSVDGKERDFDRIVLGDYVNVDGIQVPTRVGAWQDDDEPNPRIEYSFQFNVEYDESIFDRPPKITDGPEAWRAKR